MVRCQQCLLCGREAMTGLHVMGCLICFHCEKALVASVRLPRRKRLRLLALFPATAGARCQPHHAP